MTYIINLYIITIFKTNGRYISYYYNVVYQQMKFVYHSKILIIYYINNQFCNNKKK